MEGEEVADAEQLALLQAHNEEVARERGDLVVVGYKWTTDHSFIRIMGVQTDGR